ncbi:MAG: TetR/AcrR family transcriptional regulator [Bacteroidetes bacterium]|nr:TetR/AcrR family transcriptional regulator [Bacteroidota bacterium]
MEKERKLQIIRAAVKRFDKHGVNKTTLNEIARDLRIGKATIYGYFKSKEDLFFSVLDYEGSQFLEEVKIIFVKEEIPLQERFLEYFKSKENISQKYKLISDAFVQTLDDKGLDGELNFIKKLFNEEEEIIKSILTKSGNKNFNQLLPNFLVIKSWGLSLGMRFQTLSEPQKNSDFNDILLKDIENFLN